MGDDQQNTVLITTNIKFSKSKKLKLISVNTYRYVFRCAIISLAIKRQKTKNWLVITINALIELKFAGKLVNASFLPLGQAPNTFCHKLVSVP